MIKPIMCVTVGHGQRLASGYMGWQFTAYAGASPVRTGGSYCDSCRDQLRQNHKSGVILLLEDLTYRD